MENFDGGRLELSSYDVQNAFHIVRLKKSLKDFAALLRDASDDVLDSEQVLNNVTRFVKLLDHDKTFRHGASVIPELRIPQDQEMIGGPVMKDIFGNGDILRRRPKPVVINSAATERQIVYQRTASLIEVLAGDKIKGDRVAQQHADRLAQLASNVIQRPVPRAAAQNMPAVPSSGTRRPHTAAAARTGGQANVPLGLGYQRSLPPYSFESRPGRPRDIRPSSFNIDDNGDNDENMDLDDDEEEDDEDDEL